MRLSAKAPINGPLHREMTRILHALSLVKSPRNRRLLAGKSDSPILMGSSKGFGGRGESDVPLISCSL
jgi:hypothetical protein